MLRITKGGKLIKADWNPETKIDEDKDVTDTAICRLFEPCELDPDVTLKDIFLLLNTELVIFDSVIGNWCKDIVNEGLTGPEKLYTGEYHPDEIEYLELYFHLEKSAVWDKLKRDFDPNITILQGTKRPNLHGVGFELKEDKLFHWGEVEWPKGQRIPWSLSFQSAYDLINHPIRLEQKTILHDDTGSWQHPSNYNVPPVTSFNETEYTLGDILNGIIWELSFYGGPESRDEKGKELREISDEALNNAESIEDILDEE